MARIDGATAPAARPATAPAASAADAAANQTTPPKWEPTPFKPNMGSVWGTTALGGVLGAAGGVMLMGAGAGGSYGGGGGEIAAIMLGAAAVTGVIGAVIGYNIAYGGQKSKHEAEQKRQSEEIVGIPFGTIATELMTPFDHSKNGAIEIVNSTRLDSRDENVRIERREQRDGEWKYDWWDDDWDYQSTTTQQQRAFSAVDIWKAADADGDQAVAQGELESLLATFDANGDGQLQTAERTAFDAAHPILGEEWH